MRLLPVMSVALSLVAAAGQPATFTPEDATLLTPHRVELIAGDLRVPWDLAFLPDGRAVFTERPGRVRMIEKNKLVVEPLLELPAAQGNKMGLLGIAIDPEFSSSGHVFLAWNRARDRSFELVVQRYRLDGRKLIEPFTMIDGIPAWSNHTGCRLVFGPRDGLLYITTGDANQPPLAQQLDSTAGKILRLRKDGTVPESNPFTNRPGAHAAVFSYGHRNSQGLAFHPESGRLFASEHGPLHGDELNLIEAGANYGWPVISHSGSAPGMHSPAVEISPAVGPGALLYYTGTMFPELHGRLLMATLRGSSVWRFALDANQRPVAADRLFHNTWGRIRFLVQAPDGAIWLSTSMHDPPEGTPVGGDDRILRLVADPSAPPPAPVPNTGKQDTPAPKPVDLATAPMPALYATLCAGCHGGRLEGGSAPGFKDGIWRFGGTEDEITRNILQGVPNTEMIAWQTLVAPARGRELARWILGHDPQPPVPASGNLTKPSP